MVIGRANEEVEQMQVEITANEESREKYVTCNKKLIHWKEGSTQKS